MSLPRLPARLLIACAMLAGCAAPHRLDRPVRTGDDSAPARSAPPMTAARPLLQKPAPAMPEIKPLPMTPIVVDAPAAAPTLAARSGGDDARYVDLAQQELKKSYEYTGLSDVQIAQQKNGEALLVNGSARAAYEALHALNAQLKDGVKPYAIKRGDSLWIISGKPEIYGNPWLWPLIWQNNLQVIPDPNRLAVGEQLKIRPNPTIQEVVDAVNTARAKARRSDTHIGEVREENPAAR